MIRLWLKVIRITGEDWRYFVHKSLDILDADAGIVVLHTLDYMFHLQKGSQIIYAYVHPWNFPHAHQKAIYSASHFY